MGIRHFTEIRAWQEARALTREIYRLTGAPGRMKDFSVRDQLRRASVSTMSNIAEGFARRSPADFARFLDISRASGSEVESLLFVCEDIGYFNPSELASLREGVDKTLSLTSRLQEYLRSSRLQECGDEDLP